LAEVDELLPTLFPAVIADEITQAKQGVDMRFGPAHARSFEAFLDDVLVTTLHTA
jgi:hypothetical protein